MVLTHGSDEYEDSWTNLCLDPEDSGSVSNGDPDGQDNGIHCSSRKKARTSVNADPNHSDENVGSNEGNCQERKFNFQAAVHEKNFKGQKSYEKRGIIKVQDDTVDGVMRQIWEFCKRFMSKAVVFKTFDQGSSKSVPEAKWNGNEPKFEDMDQFIVFQDKSGKRTIFSSNVTTSTLQSWLGKTITIITYRYSDSVSSAQKFNAVESQLLRPLERDRAGAESITSLEQLKQTLKSKHGHHLTGNDINWSCWANYISTQPMIQRDDLISQLPPRHLIGLFRLAPIHSDTILTKTKLDLRIAENENNANKRIVGQLKEDHLNLLQVVEVMGKRIYELENQLKQHSDILSAMRSTITVQDDEYTSSLAARVPDCVDIDHD